MKRIHVSSRPSCCVLLGVSALLCLEGAFAQTPSIEQCLGSSSVIQYAEVTASGGPDTIKLENLDPSSSVIHVEACGSGGGGGDGSSTQYVAEGGGGGGSAPLQVHTLVCGRTFTAATPGGSTPTMVDCTRPITIAVPGPRDRNRDGLSVDLVTFGDGGVEKGRIVLAPGGGAGERGHTTNPRAQGGPGFQRGGAGGRKDNSTPIPPQRGGSTYGFGGGNVAATPGPLMYEAYVGGGGGGASMRGNGGRGGGQVADEANGARGGACAGGGGGIGSHVGGDGDGGKGGPGFARVTVFSLRQAALCGAAEATKSLEKIVADEVSKALEAASIAEDDEDG